MWTSTELTVGHLEQKGIGKIKITHTTGIHWMTIALYIYIGLKGIDQPKKTKVGKVQWDGIFDCRRW